MSKEKLRTDLRKKGVLLESIPYIFRALTASNRTLIEFNGTKSEEFKGKDGIIEMRVNSNSIDLVGKLNEKSNPDTFIRVTGPTGYYGGYTKDQDKFELIIAIQLDSGAIIATRAIPGLLGISAQRMGYYSPEDVVKYMRDKSHPKEDKFDIILDLAPTIKVDLNGKIMSYREPFEPSKLIERFKDEKEATRQIEEITENLLKSGIPEGVVLAFPKVLEASNRTFVGVDGTTSRAILGTEGLIVSNIGCIARQNSITLTGYNSEGLPNALTQIKEPYSYNSGKISRELPQVKIALFNEDGSIFVTTAFPGESELISPEVSVYSSEKAIKYQMENLNIITDVFDIIFSEKIKPDSVTKLRCQTISYRTAFEATKIAALIEKGKKIKQRH